MSLPNSSRRNRRGGGAGAPSRSPLVLGVLVVLFYIMALVQGPSIMNRPL